MPARRHLRLAACLSLAAATANGQIDVLRRARDAARDATPSVASLFGKEPAITTTIDDARDGVASLDGFEPESYSPMAEMPQAREGTILLVPGTYVLVTQSFCLKPGTYGPRTGAGYLHAEWKGEKAPLVSSVVGRSVDHPEVPQYQVQLLLWAIVMRADVNQLYPETKKAAAQLLTPRELLDLEGYKLGTVPDPVRKRVLESVPEPARSVLEAENEMRRLLLTAETQYSDVERVAVRTGALPPGEAMMTVPSGRWSYHPSGFFIRYAPRSYALMRVDIYYPDRFELHRDASGRITSVTKSDGRELRPNRPPSTGTWMQVNASRETAARIRLLESLANGSSPDARSNLLALARADYEDLSLIERTVNARDMRLAREAAHSALARYIGISHLTGVPRGSPLERVLRPRRGRDGYRYAIAPVATVEANGATPPMPGISQWNPSRGGATPGGNMQRLGPSGAASSLPSYAPAQSPSGGPGDEPSNEPDILDKAKEMVDKLSTAADIFSLATDPAGFVAGRPGAQLTGAGFDALFSTARGVSNGMQGRDSGDEEVEVVPDYQNFARPRTIQIPSVTHPDPQSPKAPATDAVIGTTFRTAMALEALATTRTRFAAAVAANDTPWVKAQGQALIHLKRLAGVEMVRLSRELETLQRLAGNGPFIRENEVREAQRELAAKGWSAERLAVARQLGKSDAELETQRRRVLALDPRATELGSVQAIRSLRVALFRYGAYLGLLPEVPPPWD